MTCFWGSFVIELFRFGIHFIHSTRMPNAINSDDSNSSDDFYDNFGKIKAKAAMEKKKIAESQRSAIIESGIASVSDNATAKNKNRNTKNSSTKSKCNSDDDLLCLSDGDDDLGKNQSNPSSHRSSREGSIIIESTSTLPEVIVLRDDPSPPKKAKSSSLLRPNMHTCTINICSKNGSNKMFIQEMDDPIKCLIDEYAERTDSDPAKILLFTKQLKRCGTKDTPRTLGFIEGSSVELDAFENLDEERDDVKTIRIKYQMKGRKTVTTKIIPDVPFSRLKELFCQENQLNPTKVQFIFDSCRLGGTETASTLGLEDGDCIDVYLIK